MGGCLQNNAGPWVAPRGRGLDVEPRDRGAGQCKPAFSELLSLAASRPQPKNLLHKKRFHEYLRAF